MLFICLITADVEEKSKHELLVYMAKETFVFAKSGIVEAWRGGGVGVWGVWKARLSTVFPLIFTRIPHPELLLSLYPEYRFFLFFFF